MAQSQTYERCYKSHPPLKLKGDLVIYGGSCSDPVPKDADIYIGLDYSMKEGLAPPWEGKISYRYPVTDMHAPSDPATFDKLVRWLAEQIEAGKKVHVGCIGGHGRTGTLFAALVKVMLGEEDAIQYVRDGYCKKAVESKAQVDFLVKHYGIKARDGAKAVFHREQPAPWKAPEQKWEPEAPKKKYSGAVTSYEYGTSGKSSSSRSCNVEPSQQSMKSIWKGMSLTFH